MEEKLKRRDEEKVRAEAKKRILVKYGIVTLVTLVVMFVFVITFVFVPGVQAPPGVGDIIQFGEWDWRVLDIQNDRALIITKNVIERRPYNVDFAEDVTWETSSLREYLNGTFLQRFTEEELGRIVEAEINNPDNLWYGTSGGESTIDKVFLLSLEEADRYFGDSGDYRNRRRMVYDSNLKSWAPINYGFAFTNTYDSDRTAKYDSHISEWWLRSPGRASFRAANVNTGGEVIVSGKAAISVAGVRPALWLNL